MVKILWGNYGFNSSILPMPIPKLGYTDSKGLYGNMAPFSTKFSEFENALQYKYDWMAL